MSELDALDPVPAQVKLSTGTYVEIEPLRSRQFFKFLRIVTHGALPLVNNMSLFQVDENTSAAEFGQRLLSVMLLSIPDAEDETIEFLQAMVRPVGVIEGRALSKQDKERNAELWALVDQDMANPDLDDLVTLIEGIIRREAGDIQALGKRLMGLMNLAQKTGQLDSPTLPTPNFSAASPEPSTSSPASTAGPTSTSDGSPSLASANA